MQSTVSWCMLEAPGPVARPGGAPVGKPRSRFLVMRAELRTLFRSTLESLDLQGVLERAEPRVLRFIRQSSRTPIRVIAFGKAALPMARWFVDRFGESGVNAVVSAPDCAGLRHPGVQCFDGGHPVPNAESLHAGAAALALAESAAGGDAVVFLISGGGSALLAAPLRPQIGIQDLQALNRALVTCGADIVSMNAVRKHVSAVKGGRLARAAHPARQLTLYLSDVPEGADDVVASGPTMPDASTLDDARRVIAAHGLERSLPRAIASLVADPTLPETPKPGDPCFANCEWVRLLGNADAIDAAVRFAHARGWRDLVDTSVDDMTIPDAATRLLDRLRRASREAADRPVCVISGGELSSPVTGSGVGGRNQAFVLECVERIAGERIAVLSAGTDGIDGNSPAAGAVADGSTLERARALGMDPADYARRSDSYTFFETLGEAIMCGPTGNNVRDIRALVAWPEETGGV